MPLLDHHLTLNLNYLPQPTMKYHDSVLGLTSFAMKGISIQGYILASTAKDPQPALYPENCKGTLTRKIRGHLPLKVLLPESTQ